MSKPSKKLSKAFSKSNAGESESTGTENRNQLESFSSQKSNRGIKSPTTVRSPKAQGSLKAKSGVLNSHKKPRTQKIYKVERTYSNQISPSIKKVDHYYDCSRKSSQKGSLTGSLVKLKKNKRQSARFERTKQADKLIL